MKKLIVLSLIVLMFIGCSTKSEKLIIGVIKPSLNHLPVEFGFETGDLNKEDYIIKQFSSGWETNEALAAGKIDAAILPFTYVWTDVAAGKKVKTLSFFERESDGIIVSKEINEIAELDGKKIGVLRASTLDVFAEMFAKKHNIFPEFVYFRTPPDMAAALTSGEVDALSYYVPSIFKFDENFKILHWYSDDDRLHPCCNFAANEHAISSKEEGLKKFLDGLKDSSDKLNNSPEVAFEAAQEFFGLPFEYAKKSIYQTKYVPGLDESGKDFERRTAEQMLEKGYIKKASKLR
jgi:NitT/TauT family transport system substrate-binding protein